MYSNTDTTSPLSPSHTFETKTRSFIRPQMSLTRYAAFFFAYLMCISNRELHNANADLQWRFCFFSLFSPLEAKQTVKWVTSLFSCKDSYKLSARYVLFLPSVWPSCSRMQSLYFSFSFLRLVGSPVLTSIVYRNIDDCQTNKQTNDSVPRQVVRNTLNQYPKDVRQLSQLQLIFHLRSFSSFLLLWF